MAVMRYFVSDGGGNSQFNFRTRSGFAPEFQLRAEVFRTFTDSGKPPVSGASALARDFRVDALAIIADEQAKQTVFVPYLGLDIARVCVQKGISQQFAGDPVGLDLEDRRQGSPRPLHGHTEARRIGVCILGAR